MSSTVALLILVNQNFHISQKNASCRLFHFDLLISPDHAISLAINNLKKLSIYCDEPRISQTNICSLSSDRVTNSRCHLSKNESSVAHCILEIYQNRQQLHETQQWTLYMHTVSGVCVDHTQRNVKVISLIARTFVYNLCELISVYRILFVHICSLFTENKTKSVVLTAETLKLEARERWLKSACKCVKTVFQTVAKTSNRSSGSWIKQHCTCVQPYPE